VSKTSLEQSAARLALHGVKADLALLQPAATQLPFETASVDYIHSSGVLHHVPQVEATLRELRRVLRPAGAMRVMVYNYASLWLHLYVAYVRQIAEGKDRSLPVREAFTRSTDGPDCPVAEAYVPEQFCRLAERCGFSARYLGAAVSMWELSLLPRRFEAIMCEALPREHRDFLLGLTFDAAGAPLHGDSRAGVDASFLLEPR
jgi:SAM-dependent methyltransferase